MYRILFFPNITLYLVNDEAYHEGETLQGGSGIIVHTSKCKGVLEGSKWPKLFINTIKNELFFICLL